MEDDKITGIVALDAMIKQKGLKPWIKFFGWIAILGGIVGIASLCVFLLRKEQYLTRWESYNLPICIAYYGLYKNIILAPLSLTAGIGLLKMRQWGRQLYVLNVLFLIVNNFLDLFTKGMVSLLSIVFGMAVVYFFTRPKVKEQFKESIKTT